MTVTAVPDVNASLLDWAQWYAAQSWPVIPMHTPSNGSCSCRDGSQCKHPGKHPRTPRGRNDASTNRQTIADWWQQWPDANIAIRTDTLCVLDIDLRHQGHQSLDQLQQHYGRLPDCPRVISGSGGEHYYFSLPADGIAVPSSDGVLAPGIDIKGFQGNINVPPTLHSSGHRYVWDVLFSLDAFPLPPPPTWLVDLARQARAQSAQTYQPGIVIPEGSRYHYLIGVAGRSRANGFSEAQIYDALCIANQNCQPPEDDRELRKYAKWAARKDMADPYTLMPASLAVTAAPVPLNGQAATASASAPNTPQWGTPFDFGAGVSDREVMRTLYSPERFLVDKLVPDGLTMLAAPAKSYKSYFSLSLAMATVGAGHWCDAFPVEETGPVVFFALEGSQKQLYNRLRQLCPGYAPEKNPHEIIFFFGMKALPSFRNGLQHSIEEVIDYYHPRLIVIDPLSYLYRLGRQDDLASATLDLLWPLADMVSAAGVALFAPEHMRKGSKEDVSLIDQVAGSWVKSAVAHAMLTLKREGDDIVMKTTMRDAGEQELVLNLTFDESQHRAVWGFKGTHATAGASRMDSLKTKALQELQSRRYPMSIPDLIAALSLPNTDHIKSNLRQILHRAERDGTIAILKRGEYHWIGQ